MNKEIVAYLIIGIVASFLISKNFTKWLIPKLISVKMGQKILDIGPRWHKNKEGTPTMGGLAFLLAYFVMFVLLIAFAVFRNQVEDVRITAAVFLFTLANGAIGFIDDYTKFFKKQNKGLSASVKFLLQFVVATAFTIYVAYLKDFSAVLYIPFADIEVYLGWGWYIVSILIITGIVNSVNLTDGVDGLAASVTFFVSCFFAVAGAVAAMCDLVILSAVIIGICLGFLVYNINPAKIFMGDTGSLFLGGAVVSMAYMLDNPLILLVVGIIYVIEAASDIIQVSVYKLTGKRVFKMAPIHHHFEQCKWSEMKIVVVFCSVTIIFCILAFFGI